MWVRPQPWNGIWRIGKHGGVSSEAKLYSGLGISLCFFVFFPFPALSNFVRICPGPCGCVRTSVTNWILADDMLYLTLRGIQVIKLFFNCSTPMPIHTQQNYIMSARGTPRTV